ncbi:MAG: ABC transporter ATP-binding protein [Clostridia bacterium]|nr:ABC transporter ATP-binding protein [Clostridia bacterium]
MQNTAQKRTMRDNLRIFRHFLPYFKPRLPVLLLDLFCASLTTICDLVLPLIVRYITNLGTTNLAALTIATVVKLSLLYVALRIVDTAANYFMQSVGHIMGTHIETDMRRDLFAHMQKLPHAYYSKTKIGQLMSRITSDLFDITEFAHHFPEELFITSIKVVVAFVILCGMNIPLTLIIFASLPLMVVCSDHFAKPMRKSFKDSRHQLGEINARVEDSLSGIRVVKSFANEDIEEEKFAEGNCAFLDVKRRMYHNMAGFHSVTRMFDGIMYILVVCVGAIFMIQGRISAADLVAYLLYVTTLLASVRRLVEFTENFQRGITGIERFAEVMEEPVAIHDLPGARELKDVSGELEFDDVSFAYDDGGTNVLSHINLHVNPGESVALVGPSGGGKTTLCNLIPRFYEVTSGVIRIDGTDIRDYTLHSLRKQIGMVQQDVYLFSGTVLTNIEYGRPGASREEIIQAAKLAGAHEFISELENGYDTYVGEHGVKLSGGQKQRISIARVFLKNPPILILDEATSALDNESEHLVQQSLEGLMKGRTTFTIAHRLTTIRGAATILVLTDEGIVEQGSHDALMAKKGVYYNLYRMYQSEDA